MVWVRIWKSPFSALIHRKIPAKTVQMLHRSAFMHLFS